MVCEVDIVTHDLSRRFLLSYCRIRPILYRVAIAKVRTSGIISSIQQNAQTTEVAQFVRDLLIISTALNHDQESHVTKLLSTFRNVENLAIWGAFSYRFPSSQKDE